VAAPADRVLVWERILAWAERRPERLFGHNPWQLGAHVLRTALRHRVTGPAAEMSFFAMLTLVPVTVAVGAALGQIQRFVGPEKIARGQDAAIGVVRVVISPELTDEVVDPFVRAQLSQQRGGGARPSAGCC
jgi:membrane protein